MTAIAGPAGAATVPPPARLYWHPSREVSITIAQGASGLINICRTGPMPPGAVMETPDQDLPWTLPDGQWEVHLRLTARRYPALHLHSVIQRDSGQRLPHTARRMADAYTCLISICADSHPKDA
jgi:hypothetical protein